MKNYLAIIAVIHKDGTVPQLHLVQDSGDFFDVSKRLVNLIEVWSKLISKNWISSLYSLQQIDGMICDIPHINTVYARFSAELEARKNS